MKTTYRSLSSLVEGLSNTFSTQIDLVKSAADNGAYELRFADLEPKQAFKLVIQRHWKSTEIRFVADPFASKTLGFLASEAYAKREQILNLMESSRGSYSDCTIRINGVPLFELTGVEPNAKLEISIELLSAESSIELGLITDSEAQFVSFSVGLVALLLPIPPSRYTNPDEVSGYPEGSVSHVLVNKYERDPRNRRLAIQIHGSKCMACGFDFEKVYGPVGSQYVVIHHTTPVSEMGPHYTVNPLTDLVAICANCHAMAHRRNPPFTVHELQELMKGMPEN